MDDTLARNTHAWTCRQSCKNAQKANGWHKQAWLAYHRTKWKGRGMQEETSIIVMHPKWLHPDKALWASDVTTQPYTR